MKFTRRVALFAVGLLLLGAIPASAFPRHAIIVPRVGVYRSFTPYTPYVYDPFWGPPWYSYGYAYSYSGPAASIRTEVTPKDAEVYVDGYYAGRADEFDGVFKHLEVVPGGHAVTFHLQGFRTVTEDVYVRPDSTFKMKETMERLAAGETSAPVPAPSPAPRGLAMH